MANPQSLVFAVHRRDPVVVTPAGPTPRELKILSDIDDQQCLRFHISGIHFFRPDPSASHPDPAAVVKDALARALVFYYPLAGRLLEGQERKLMVDCTGEGVVFVEADADVRLDDFGPHPEPPFPCLEELVYPALKPQEGYLKSPLLSVQVTRLKCGGFIFAHSINHVVADAAGTLQFMKAVGELARGARTPSVLPAWARENLMARDPPRVTFPHPEYDDEETPAAASVPAGEMIVRSFFFGSREISALRRRLPPHLRSSTTRFEILTAFLWRSRTAALGTDPGEEVRARFIVNARDKVNPPLPEGFYGNALVYPVARTTARELWERPLAYAVELVRAAKAEITEEYLRSTADLLVLRGRPHYALARTFRVSDVTRLGFEEVDLGWGAAAYCGPAVGGGRMAPRGGSNYVRSRGGTLVPVCLPGAAMGRFAAEVESLLEEPAAVIEESCGVKMVSHPTSTYHLVSDVGGMV